MSVSPKQFCTRDVLIFLNQEGLLLGLDLRHGWEIWRVQYSPTECPELIDVVDVNGQIYLILFGKDSKEYSVNALNEYTGDLKWTAPVNGLLQVDALVGTDEILIVTNRKYYGTTIKAVNVKKGNLIWNWGMGGHGGGFDPMITDNRVYVGVSAYDSDESFIRNNQKVWPISVYCLAIETGTVLWKSWEIYAYTDEHHRKMPLISSNPHTIHGGILGIDVGDGTQHILNSVTGELLWIFDTNTQSRI